MIKKLFILAAISAILVQISFAANDSKSNQSVNNSTNVINVASDLVEDEGGISHLPIVKG